MVSEFGVLNSRPPYSEFGQVKQSRNIRGTVGKLSSDLLNPVSGSKTDHPARMLALQKTMPQLPVPALNQTMEKYLIALKPLLSEKEYVETEKIVKKFGLPGYTGRQLQVILENRAAAKTNWLDEWWLNKAYLEGRMPVVVHSSPALILPAQDYSGIQGQIRYAAKLLSGILDYKTMIDDGTLPIQYQGKDPTCMKQYYLVLNSCRIPGKRRDTVISHPANDPDRPKHIIVIHNNHIFSLDVYGENGERLNTFQLHKQLERVVGESAHIATPVGLLTAESRPVWAQAYNQLMKKKVNKKSLEEIQKSIMVLCLDQPMLHTADEGARADLYAGQMSHGGGSRWNSGNRWYDKTLQVIVGADGAVGCVYEHALAEGPPIVSILDHTLDYIAKGTSTRLLPATSITPPRKLQFDIPASVVADIEGAKESIDSLVEDLDLSASIFKSFGKNFVKSQRLSPDAFIQLSFQLAFFRTYGQTCSTYETASTKMFQEARTENIGCCTSESLAFCQAMGDASLTAGSKVDLLKKAVARHSAKTREAMNGEGIDRHLFGLKLAALESRMNIPDLFMDSSYQVYMHHRISTSQVPGKHELSLFFGPVVPDGFGICYNPQPDQILYVVTAFNSSPETNAKEFSQCIGKCLEDMHDLLLQGSVLKSKL